MENEKIDQGAEIEASRDTGTDKVAYAPLKNKTEGSAKKESSASDKSSAKKDGSVKKSTAADKKKNGREASASKSSERKKSGGKSSAPREKKKNSEKEEGDTLFSSVPESFSLSEVIPIEIDSDEEQIERDAIAALGETHSLELLLYDGDEELPGHETSEESAAYESFFIDYKETISAALSMAKAEREATESSEQKEIVSEEIGMSDDSSEENRSKTEAAQTDLKPTEEVVADEEEERPLLTKEKPIDEESADEGSQEPISEDGEEESIKELLSAAEEQNEKARSAAENEFSEITLKEEDQGGEQLEMDLDISEPENFANEEDELSQTDTEQKADKEAPTEQKSSFIHSLFDFVELFVFTLVAIMFITSFIFRHTVVDGHSMDKTLAEGDRLLAYNLFYEPDYGDIVIFNSNSNDGKILVKRVIALAGDTVDCYYADGDYVVYVNGKAVDESAYKYVDGPPHSGSLAENVTGYIVPEGHVFVLGDHRNNSSDSRIFGSVDKDRILGKVVLRFYPFDSLGAVD